MYARPYGRIFVGGDFLKPGETILDFPYKKGTYLRFPIGGGLFILKGLVSFLPYRNYFSLMVSFLPYRNYFSLWGRLAHGAIVARLAPTVKCAVTLCKIY